MNHSKTFFAIVAGLFLSACSHTTVVLMPDEDGKVGVVSVKAKDESRTVDKAYDYTSVSWLRSRPAEVQAMRPEQVTTRFGDTLKAQPSKPRQFILYFVMGTSDITEASQALIPQVLATIKQRSPTEVTIIGHTDTTGTEKLNAQISLERAKVVEKILRDAEPKLGKVDLKYFGEKELLVPTKKNVDEPRNRRVEIMVL